MQLNREEIQAALDSEIAAVETTYGKGCKLAVIKILSLEKMLNPETKEKEPQLIPLSKWNEYYPDPSVNAMRMLVFRRHENGFDDFNVVERRGNRVLINVDNYNEWRKNRN